MSDSNVNTIDFNENLYAITEQFTERGVKRILETYHDAVVYDINVFEGGFKCWLRENDINANFTVLLNTTSDYPKLEVLSSGSIKGSCWTGKLPKNERELELIFAGRASGNWKSCNILGR
jgi:hypothetical protein